MVVSRKKGTTALGVVGSSYVDTVPYWFKNWVKWRWTLKRKVASRKLDVSVPCTLVWRSSGLSMRRGGVYMLNPPGRKERPPQWESALVVPLRVSMVCL